MEFWQLLGDLHPRLVQFPLVLLLAGLLFDATGLFLRMPQLNLAAKILSAAGTCFLLVAFICGIYAEIWAGRAGIPQEQIEWHELMANLASWGFVVLMAWRIFLDPAKRRALIIYTIAGLCWYSLLVLTGYLGGKLVFQYGAAVVGAQANDVLTMHDLNVLATRQMPQNLRYSEMMHHIFGWLVLALSGSLFVHAMFPKSESKLRWVGPALLLAGGIFLFFFADLDLYRLLDPRQLRDREVQLHKTLAVILCVVGFMGVRRRKPQIKVLGATAGISREISTPSKLVAVMALIGGGMLFTHVHTVAPYANVAAGVYIAHIFLGVTALCIGAARLLQDGWPRYRGGLSVVFSMLMCVESVLLITYNEGLPWYIGYGHYNRDGPHEGTIAPYGSLRAELTFDKKTQRMDLYVLDRFKNDPIEVPTSKVNVLVARRYETVAIPLVSDNDASPASHFSALAPFLLHASAFSAQAALPIGSGMKMGYFDPWVDPLIQGIPPNVLAKYQCPMHEGMQSITPGVCPICGMPLVPILYTPRMTIHDADYDMRLETTPSAGIQPGRQVMLRFTPLQKGTLLRELALVHEHLLHLIITSADLTYFDHVHPVMQPDGSLVLPYTFPKTGQYLLYADITPQGQRNQVFRLPVTVGDAPADDPPNLIPDPAAGKPLAADPSMTAELIFQLRTPQSGLHVNFLFRLKRQGLPIRDLEPYIGAMGHCVIISEDTQTYLHCHPEQLENPTPDARSGPDVPFHTVFPRPGLYKIWGQFKRGGHVIVADFVVRVDKPLLPPKLINFLLDD